MARLLAAERLLTEHGKDDPEARGRALEIMIAAAVQFDVGRLPLATEPDQAQD